MTNATAKAAVMSTLVPPHGFCVTSGGPGTGKTLELAAAIEINQDLSTLVSQRLALPRLMLESLCQTFSI
jgi:hypothetical protein